MQKIPAEVREAIRASDWERTIFNIGREHKMHIDDIDTLSIETILTMIGLEHPKDYPENIQKRIGLKDEELKRINKLVKESKLKVNSQIQGDQIRVIGKKRDDLQTAIAALKAQIKDIDLQFVNFRE